MSDQPKSKPKEKTNATSRLLHVLHTLDQTNTAKPSIDVLCDVLQVKPTPLNRTPFIAVTVFHRMCKLAEEETLLHLPDEWMAFEPHFAGVRNCLTPPALNSRWDQRKSSLTSADITGLGKAAIFLKRYVSEVVIGDAETSELREAISQMAAALDTEEMSEYTRRILRERLDAITTALDEYRFWGASDLKDVYRNFVSVVVTDDEVQTTLKADASKGGHLAKKLGIVLTLLLGTLKVADKAYDVGAKYLPVIEYLLPAPPAERITPPHRGFQTEVKS